MSDDLTREEVHGAADRLVDELLEAAGVTRPPVDVLELAWRHLHMAVREDGPRRRGAYRGRRRRQSRRAAVGGRSGGRRTPQAGPAAAAWDSTPPRGSA